MTTSDAIDAWAECTKKYVDLWTSDPTLHRAYATWIGALTNLWLGGAKSYGPIPNSGKVNPKQPAALVTVTIPAQSKPTGLRATAFVDGARHTIPNTLVTLTPDSVPAGNDPTPVVVSVTAPIGVPGGRYAGTIIDDDAAIVMDAEVTIVPV